MLRRRGLIGLFVLVRMLLWDSLWTFLKLAVIGLTLLIMHVSVDFVDRLCPNMYEKFAFLMTPKMHMDFAQDTVRGMFKKIVIDLG